MENARNSNIELLRIILMFMVIALHFNNSNMGGAYNFVKIYSFNYFLLNFFESLSICAVDCFMIISGFFLAENKKIKSGKILYLLLIVIGYRIFDYAISLFLHIEEFSLKSFLFRFVPCNYFAIFYIVTYVFSPFVTILLDSLSLKLRKTFFLLLILLFIIYNTILNCSMDLIPGLQLQDISVISTKGDFAGYNIVHFFVLLITGIYIKKYNFSISTKFLVLLFLINTLIMTFFSIKIPSLFNYSSIFPFINAICIFLFFNKVKINCKIINYISKSVFPIFCIHTLPCSIYLWKKIITVERISQNCIQLLFFQIISVLIMFLFCFIIDILFRNTVGLLLNKVCKRCPIINLENM